MGLETHEMPFSSCSQAAQTAVEGEQVTLRGWCAAVGSAGLRGGAAKKPRCPSSPCPALWRSCQPTATPGPMFLRSYLPHGFQLG